MKAVDTFPAVVLLAVSLCVFAHPRPARNCASVGDAEAQVYERTRAGLYQDHGSRLVAISHHPAGKQFHISMMSPRLLSALASGSDEFRLRAASTVLTELDTLETIPDSHRPLYLACLLAAFRDDPGPQVRRLIGVFLPHIFESWRQTDSEAFVARVRVVAFPYLEATSRDPDKFIRTRSRVLIDSLCDRKRAA